MPDRRLAWLFLAAIACAVPSAVLAQTVEPSATTEQSAAPPGAVEAAAGEDVRLDDIDEPVEEGAALPHDLSPIGMFLGADAVVKSVIGGLAAASVATWAIFFGKLVELGAARRRWSAFRQRLAHADTLDDALERTGRRRDAAGRLVRAAADEVELSHGLPAAGARERVATRFERVLAGAGREMQRGTGILASIGSLSPFVGLFGTVWGIMNSFIGISQSNTTNLAIVAPGIAEALFATGVGLAAAIPAVLFYNVFARMIAGNRAVLADVAAEVTTLVSRDLDRASLRGPVRLALAAE